MSNLVYFNFFCFNIIIIGFIGVMINKKNIIYFLVCLEIIYNGILLLVLFSWFNNFNLASFSYYLIILTVVASEAVVGLTLVILYNRLGLSLELASLSILNG